MIKRFSLLFLVALLASVSLTGCVTITGQPEGPQETRYDDAGIKTGIASALLKKDAAKANDINVHCFNGHVFLIGEADKDFRGIALNTARQAEGVVHVTTHWFPTGTAATLDDSAIETEVDAQLLFTENLSVRRVAVDVWGGHVVLTGIASSQAEIDNAINKIKKIKQVRSVTSYLTLE